MIKLQNLLLFLPLMLLAGCHEPAVEGKWLQPVPGMAGAVQAFGWKWRQGFFNQYEHAGLRELEPPRQ